MRTKTGELIEILNELQTLTSNDGLDNWANLIKTAKLRLESSDYSGIEYLLKAYGSMGSFNDIYIQSNKELDQRLHFLKTEAWKLANYIKHNHEINT